MKVTAVIGLGSNLNQPLVQLRKACRQLKKHSRMAIKAYSDIYQSKPLVPDNAPASWRDQDYLNAAVSIETDLTPHDLLRILKKIEHDMGRRPAERWAPRVIDLDILTFGDLNIDDKELHIPHLELHKRSFALLPLLDVCPDYPHSKYTLVDLKKIPQLLNGPQIMGILNITPDSFSDGGRFINPEAAIRQAQRLVDEGADIIDIGAESTRPGATLIDVDLEWQRLAPILKILYEHWDKKEHRPLISIDTRRAETVEKSLEYSIDWINDQSQAEFLSMVPLIKKHHLKYVAMHHCGLPSDPNRVIRGNPVDVLKEYQKEWLNIFSKYDLDSAQLIIDPGIGFGKTVSQQVQILNCSREIRLPSVSYLMGHSRKSFIKGLLTDPNVAAKEMVTAMISARLASDGVDYLRVHEPKINLEAIRVQQSFSGHKE